MTHALRTWEKNPRGKTRAVIYSTASLLTEFESHIVNYGPRFTRRFMVQAQSARAIYRRGKTRVRNLQ